MKIKKLFQYRHKKLDKQEEVTLRCRGIIFFSFIQDGTGWWGGWKWDRGIDQKDRHYDTLEEAVEQSQKDFEWYINLFIDY